MMKNLIKKIWVWCTTYEKAITNQDLWDDHNAKCEKLAKDAPKRSNKTEEFTSKINCFIGGQKYKKTGIKSETELCIYIRFDEFGRPFKYDSDHNVIFVDEKDNAL